MAQKQIKPTSFSEDILEFLFLLAQHEVEYMIVGGEAVIFYGYARLTGDIDIFYNSEDSNIKKLFKVLDIFWEGDIPGLTSFDELKQSGAVFQFGVPPNRIDLLNKIEGIDFQEIYDNREEVKVIGGDKQFFITYIGLDQLIQNKEKVNRPKDKDDLKYLYKVQEKLKKKL